MQKFSIVCQGFNAPNVRTGRVRCARNLISLHCRRNGRGRYIRSGNWVVTRYSRCWKQSTSKTKLSLQTITRLAVVNYPVEYRVRVRCVQSSARTGGVPRKLPLRLRIVKLVTVLSRGSAKRPWGGFVPAASPERKYADAQNITNWLAVRVDRRSAGADAAGPERNAAAASCGPIQQRPRGSRLW